MQINLQQRDILFALYPEKQFFLGINYCLLVTRNYVYISVKNEDPVCFASNLKFLKKQARRFENFLLSKALVLFDSCERLQ